MLDCLVDFHCRAAEFVENCLERQESERVRMVLQYLAEHHRRLQEAIADYEADAERAVLDTYIAFALMEDDTPESFVDGLSCPAGLGLEEVVALAQALGDYPVTLLNDVLAAVENPHVAEVFTNLRDLEVQERKLLSRAVDTLLDL
ncbi:MAG: hypothetical protein KatS3mg124_2056 [Porticoccaceae bacterium]|nr:MAG: hypothetical protein KatS3mg124_2056 [Porticoccaceae bacterium]